MALPAGEARGDVGDICVGLTEQGGISVHGVEGKFLQAELKLDGREMWAPCALRSALLQPYPPQLALLIFQHLLFVC